MMSTVSKSVIFQQMPASLETLLLKALLPFSNELHDEQNFSITTKDKQTKTQTKSKKSIQKSFYIYCFKVQQLRCRRMQKQKTVFILYLLFP